MIKKGLLAPVLNKEIVRKIKQRRRQIMVHSCIYYEMDTTIVSDKQFDSWAYELKELQKQFPNESKEAELYEEFKDWDATTGYNLNFHKFYFLAERLLSYKRKELENDQEY